MRYELTGSGVGLYDAATVRRILTGTAAERPRLCRQFGWRNQPVTVSFAAPDDATADKLADYVMRELRGADAERSIPRLFASRRPARPL